MINDKMQAQGGCPKGTLGRLAGFLMNNIHRGVYNFGLKFVDIDADDSVLDIGCGGGQLLNMLSHMVTIGKLCGMDHSEDMVRMAKKKNRRNKNVYIRRASVSRLPFSDDEFDIVTAFETIQFWPHIEDGLKEAHRVLRPQGGILITNRYPKEGSGWTEFLALKSEEDYINALEKAGFVNVIADAETKNNWIRVVAQK